MNRQCDIAETQAHLPHDYVFEDEPYHCMGSIVMGAVVGYPRLPCGKTVPHQAHEWRGPTSGAHLWCAGVSLPPGMAQREDTFSEEEMGSLDKYEDGAVTHEHGQHTAHTHSADDYANHQLPIDNEVFVEGEVREVETYAVKLRQLTMEVPEYEWLSNSGTITRIAEEMAAQRGWVLDQRRMPVEEAGDSPARLVLAWLAEDTGDPAEAKRRLAEEREAAGGGSDWTYWLAAQAWAEANEEEQQSAKEFALMALRHEGYLVKGACQVVEETLGRVGEGFPVVGLRWPVEQRREVADLESDLV